MDYFDLSLQKKFNWYHYWHNHPRHRHTHWLIFGLFLFSIASLFFVELINLHFEKNIAQAQSCDFPPSFNLVIICDFLPKTAQPETTVQIAGYFMGDSVTLINPITDDRFEIQGNAGSDGTSLNFVIPSGMPAGYYKITVLAADWNGIGTANDYLKIVTFTESDPQFPESEPIPFSEPAPEPPTPAATEFQDLIGKVFDYSLIFVGIAVFLMILWGGILWLTSAANPGNISTAKRYITNALLGAILLASAYVILYTINPELVGGELTLEKLKPPPVPPATTSNIVRLVAFDEAGAASAITSGCAIATELSDFTTVECPAVVAESLGLEEVPIFQVEDDSANQQIGATTVINAGNQGQGRKIIVLDSGYNYNHPELSSSYGGGYDFVNKDNDPMDDLNGRVQAHGSHVSGIITADGIDPRARGVAPQTQIIAGKIVSKTGKINWDHVIDSIYWSVEGRDRIYGTSDDFKADAINLSIGGEPFSSICNNNSQEYIKKLVKAIKYARDNGVVVVVASGNKEAGVSVPGCINESLTVGAVDRSDRLWPYSNRGAGVDVVAPGVGIYSPILGTDYQFKDGTSMATPIVSGLIALIKNAHPDYTVDQVEQAIISTVRDLGAPGKDTSYGWGRITANAASTGAQPPVIPPLPGGSGKISLSPSSCAKTLISNNPNCNTIINYTVTSLTSGNLVLIGKDGFTLQTITCNAPCSGSITDSNPAPGTHKYTINLPNGALITEATSYINAYGTISSNFTSCAKSAGSANPNCNITLTINGIGVYPGSVIVTKNGINWRIIRCPDPACRSVITDSNPAPGTHTYAIFDGASKARLGRVTVNISTGGISGVDTVTLCTGTNFTGTCVNFYSQIIPDLRNTAIGNDTAISMRSNIGRVYLCRDINYGGLCEGFGAGNYPDLSTRAIGANQASSMLESPRLQRITMCSDTNFTGICEIFTTEDPNLSDNAIGNDTTSSLYVDMTDVRLCTDLNFSGACYNFPTGYYPNLGNLPIGDNQVSSIMSL